MKLLVLLEDIRNGRGQRNHLTTMNDLAGMLVKNTADKICVDSGHMVISVLEEYRHVFLTHIEAHYCSTGECTTLIAAPCQMAFPAGVDVPSYVALVGEGRYKEALEVLRGRSSTSGCAQPGLRASLREGLPAGNRR